MKIEKIFININYEDFVIHLKLCEGAYMVYGEVYPIQKYYINNNNDQDWGYLLSSNKDIYEPQEPNNDCRKLFDFSFCWRGCWEGRIYFKDDEYWSEELKTMSELWDILILQLKEKIKINNPQISKE